MKNPLKTYSKIYGAAILIAVIAYMLNRGYEPSYILGMFLVAGGTNVLLNVLIKSQAERKMKKAAAKTEEPEKQDTLV